MINQPTKFLPEIRPRSPRGMYWSSKTPTNSHLPVESMKFNSHRFYFWSVKKSQNPDIDVFSLIKLELRKILKKVRKKSFIGEPTKFLPKISPRSPRGMYWKSKTRTNYRLAMESMEFNSHRFYFWMSQSSHLEPKF